LIEPAKLLVEFGAAEGARRRRTRVATLASASVWPQITHARKAG